MSALPDVTDRIDVSAFETPRTVTLASPRAIWGLLGAYGVGLVAMVLARVLPSVLVAPFVALTLSLVPGALLVLALGPKNTSIRAPHVLYAFGGSLVVLMIVGTVVNLVLPTVGVQKPLMPVPLGAGVTASVLVLAALAYWRTPDGTITVEIPPLWSPPFFALLLLPLLSIIGVTLLNVTGINGLLVLVLLAIAIVPLVALWHLESRWYSLGIWTTSLAILYHKSLWRYAGFGGRPHGITAWEAGRWSPGVVSIDPYSSELLQNGVLFPLFARLMDLFIITQYEVVNPFFVSFIPLALYAAFRQYVDADVAFLGATTFAFAHPFYFQYPTAGRAATPVLFLALFGVVLSNRHLSGGSRGILAMAFLAGVVVTHYGTSYYMLAGFAIAIVLLYVLRVLDDVVERMSRRIEHRSDGGTPVVARATDGRRPSLFTISTVLFVLSSALGWYLYMRRGWKFNLLPKHVYDNLMTLIRGSPGGGRTAARVQENYASASIQISKKIYIMLAALIVLGLLVTYYRRLVKQESSFDDHYLAIATALFGIFVTTIVLSNWGGGRPMMITFSFTTVFAVIGAVWLGETLRRGFDALPEHLAQTSDLVDGVRRHSPLDELPGAYAFACLMLLFFALNSGVVAATVVDGLAPSNVPAQSVLETSKGPESQVTVHRGTDVVTHVWLVQHLDSRYSVYADTFGARQYDWFRPDVAARTPAIGGGYTAETKPEVFDVERQEAGTQPGYVLIMGHNLELDTVWVSKIQPGVPMEDLCLDRRNRIYTTGESHIYFYPEPTDSAATDAQAANRTCGESEVP